MNTEKLHEKILPEKSKEMFELFAKDTFPKIRLLAVKIGKEYELDISKFILIRMVM